MFSKFPALKGALCISLLLSAPAFAQAPAARGAGTYPDKPVRVVIGAVAGGLPDTVARVVGQEVSKRWGQQWVIDNKPGASGVLAADYVAKSAPDGYTVLLYDNTILSINPFLYAKLPYSEKDLVPASYTARAPLFLAVHPSVGVNTFPELVALAKAKPGQLSYGSSGIGSPHHLGMEYLNSALGLGIVHVPYKGSGQSVPAVVAGQVAMAFSAYPSLASYVRDGRIKLLGVNSAQRSQFSPQVPAVAETVPGFAFAGTIGIYVPRATPPAVLTKIGADVAEAVKVPDVVSRLGSLGIEAVGGSGEEWAAVLKADAERYSRVIKQAGIKAE
jgi:tripartite-type tricarboxylate transporter receptor subunit TctC